MYIIYEHIKHLTLNTFIIDNVLKPNIIYYINLLCITYIAYICNELYIMYYSLHTYLMYHIL